MSEMMTSRQLVKYMQDVLFGNHSKRVFTDVKETDERYMTLGSSTLFTNFLNPDKTIGKLTSGIADGIYHRCRYNLFPEEYRKSEDVTEEETREFVNKFVCLFSCLFDINLGFFKIRKEDTLEMTIKKKENICSLLLALLNVFKGKSEVESEVVKEQLLEVFFYLRFELHDINYPKFASEDIRKFRDALFNAGMTVVQNYPNHYNIHEVVSDGFEILFNRMVLTIDEIKVLGDSESAEAFWPKTSHEKISIPEGVYFWKAYLTDVITQTINERAMYAHLYYSNDYEKYINLFYDINTRLHQFEIETAKNPSNEQNIEMLRSSGWRSLSKMLQDMLYFTIFQSRLNVEFTADDLQK